MDIPVLKDSTGTELPNDFDYLKVQKISLTPISIPPGGGKGYAQLKIEFERTRARERTMKPIEKDITVFTNASNMITSCTLVSPDFLTGEEPISNSQSGSYAVTFPTGFFTNAPSNITVTPKWARYTGNEDTTWWVENVMSTGFEIHWAGPGGDDHTPGTTGVFWRADK